MTGGGRVESRPYLGPGRPARPTPTARPASTRPTPAGPFIPIGPASHSAPDGAQRYEEWGSGPTSIVGVPAEPARDGSHLADHGSDAREVDDLDAEPPARRRAERDEPGLAGDAREAVATALETIALRVRTGELEPRGFVPGMSDAAAVATALTALLTARH